MPTRRGERALNALSAASSQLLPAEEDAQAPTTKQNLRNGKQRSSSSSSSSSNSKEDEEAANRPQHDHDDDDEQSWKLPPQYAAVNAAGAAAASHAAALPHHQKKHQSTVSPLKVDLDATPPMPPTPESPAKPAWWTAEDDERGAELLYTLFGGAVGKRLADQVEEWVVRENEMAAEAFPHVEFWKGLDLRWLRFSCEHREVADALRQLKAAFASGEGRLRHVSIDKKKGKAANGGEAAPASERSRRPARKVAAAENNTDAAEQQQQHNHPLQSLTASK